MEYVYAALVLHESGREVTEADLTAVLEAAGADVDESRVKALVAALEDVDIDEAIQGMAMPAGGQAPAPATEAGDAEADEEEATEEAEAADEDEEEGEDEGPSGEGLGDLFG